jgi:hypothetical protein
MKKTWKVFWDLQCPYSRKNWANMAEIRARFSGEYEFEIQLTSLLFHRQAFPAHCAACLIEKKKGRQAKLAFVDACFQNQDKYTNAAVGDARPSEVHAILATIAEGCGVFDEEFTRDFFLTNILSWEDALLPAYTEHKEALAYGVFGAPKHVIANKLVSDTDSEWSSEDWAIKLKTIA